MQYKHDIGDITEQKAVFMAASRVLNSCDKVLLGIPMDTTTSFRPGTRLAPYRLREVSEGIEEYSVYQEQSLENIKFYDAGDVIIPHGDLNESLSYINRVAAFYLSQRKKIFSIGGEHLVSLPLIEAYYCYYSDLTVIQLDAHADLRDNYLGLKYSHATVMRNVLECIGEKNLFQLGIRSGTREEIEYGRKYSNLYINRCLDAITEIKDTIGKRPVYLSVDIDVLDPAYAPGTGTPEAGGINSADLFKLLLAIKDLNIVGFDLVEISPPYDIGDNTSLLGAKIIREALLAF